MSQSPQPVVTTSLALIEAAHEFMAHEGLTSSQIDPETIALAIHKPREVKAAEDQTIFVARRAIQDAQVQRTYGGPPPLLSDADAELARLRAMVDGPETRMSQIDAMESLQKKSKELAPNTRLKRFIAGFVIGGIAAASLTQIFIADSPSSEVTLDNQEQATGSREESQDNATAVLAVLSPLAGVGLGIGSAAAGTFGKTHRVARRRLRRAQRRLKG